MVKQFSSRATAEVSLGNKKYSLTNKTTEKKQGKTKTNFKANALSSKINARNESLILDACQWSALRRVASSLLLLNSVFICKKGLWNRKSSNAGGCKVFNLMK